jgi:uncharacterized protein YdaU (DUF1376 family)
VIAIGKQPAFQFYPGDWIQDTRILTPLTRGIWIDILCFMWRSSDRGRLEGSKCQLARILSCEKEELSTAIQELSVTKIADVTISNDDITIVNRRMYREQKERESGKIRAQRYRDNITSNAKSNAIITAPSSSSSSSSSSKEDKIRYGEVVMLTHSQYQKLCEKHTIQLTDKAIEILNNAIQSKGYKYKSHYHTLIGWPMEEARKASGNGKQPAAHKATPYQQCPSCGKEVMPQDIEGKFCIHCAPRKPLSEIMDKIGKRI